MLVATLLCSCKPIADLTEVVYNDSWSKSESDSSNIPLTQEKGENIMHFAIQKYGESNKYSLKLYWRTNMNERLFSVKNNHLSFLIDKSEIYNLEPITAPTILSYNHDRGHVEVAVFELTFEQIYRLSSAKDVQVQIKSATHCSSAVFSRRTFIEFRDFLSSAHF
ncbi:hypothetical protein [Candidatus Sarmatiella mevalonica]|uniref:hypothetical protein n=1 Tax=Candidatus Sarmatiella mevalonica TaxID=2770581 RepID=UPI001920B1E6|nr:hypothetical protein [Candidatus Sarmatiella mevalonica]